MEQGTRLDSTPVSAAQAVRDDVGPDRMLDAAVAALLTTSFDDARSADGGQGWGSVVRAPLPEPGSPEAMAMFHAAIIKYDRLSRDALHGYPDLECANGWSWTRRSLASAMENGEITPGEFARLYPLAAERQLRLDSAALATNIGALHAVAYADDFARAAEAARVESVDTSDPILAAIAETRRLTAARTAAGALPQPAGTTDPLPEQEAAAKAFYSHVDDVLLKTVPSTGAGCTAFARFAGEFLEAEGFAIDENEANDQHVRILDLIARSPLLDNVTVEQPVKLDFSDHSDDALTRAYTAFKLFHEVMKLTACALIADPKGRYFIEVEMERLCDLQNKIADEVARRDMPAGSYPHEQYATIIDNAFACQNYELAAQLAAEAAKRL